MRRFLILSAMLFPSFCGATCLQTSGPLALKKIRFGDPPAMWVSCVNDSEDILSSSIPYVVSKSTAGHAPWSGILDFPNSCMAGQYVSAVGSSLTCGTPSPGSCVAGSGSQSVKCLGGSNNIADGVNSVVSGGDANSAHNYYTVVAGGENNEADLDGAVVSGGSGNQAGNFYSTVSGGFGNQTHGYYSCVPGGFLNNATGWASFAGGARAHAVHDGSFIWNGKQYSGVSDAYDNGPNTFNIYADGGSYFYGQFISNGYFQAYSSMTIMGNASVGGRVGIGTGSTEPGAYLRINGVTNTYPSLVFSTSTNVPIYYNPILTIETAPGNYVTGSLIGDLVFGTHYAPIDFTASYGSMDMRIIPGAVGIGTGSPSAKLDVAGFMRTTNLTGAPSTGIGLEMFYHPSNDWAYIQARNAATSEYKSIEIEGLQTWINANTGGSVGIQTISPNSSFDVGNTFWVTKTAQTDGNIQFTLARSSGSSFSGSQYITAKLVSGTYHATKVTFVLIPTTVVLQPYIWEIFVGVNSAGNQAIAYITLNGAVQSGSTGLPSGGLGGHGDTFDFTLVGNTLKISESNSPYANYYGSVYAQGFGN
jgi:hypothetical protein